MAGWSWIEPLTSCSLNWNTAGTWTQRFTSALGDREWGWTEGYGKELYLKNVFLCTLTVHNNCIRVGKFIYIIFDSPVPPLLFPAPGNCILGNTRCCRPLWEHPEGLQTSPLCFYGEGGVGNGVILEDGAAGNSWHPGLSKYFLEQTSSPVWGPAFINPAWDQTLECSPEFWK